MTGQQEPTGGGGIWDRRTLVGAIEPTGNGTDGSPPSLPVHPEPVVEHPVHPEPVVEHPVHPESATGYSVDFEPVVEHPGGRSPGRRVPLLIGVATAVVLAVGVTVTALGRPAGDGAAEPGAGPAVGAPTPGRPPAPAATTPEPSPTLDAEAVALADLTRLRAQDQGVVRFDGRYAAQLASKSVGIVDPQQTASDGSHTFRAGDILAEHLLLRQEASGSVPVVLVLSTDYGRRQLYQGQPLWVTVALGGFDSRAAVTRWCTTRFPELTGTALLNRCVPRKLAPPDA